MLVLKGRRSGGDLLAFSPDGQTLVSRYEFGLQCWRPVSPATRPEILLDGHRIGWMSFSPDGERLFVDGWTSGIYDLREKRLTPFPEPGPAYRLLALSPDGRYVVASYMTSPRIMEVETGVSSSPVTKNGLGPARWSIPICPRNKCGAGRPLFLQDGRFVLFEIEYDGVFYSRERQNRLVLRSGETGKPENGSLQFASSPDRQAVSSDGRWVAGTKGNQLTVWSLTDLTQPPRVLKNDSRKNFTDLAFHPSGRYLAVSSNDTTVKLYDTATWAVAATYAWDVGKMRGVAFSPDGCLAAAGSATGRIVVWDVDV